MYLQSKAISSTFILILISLLLAGCPPPPPPTPTPLPASIEITEPQDEAESTQMVKGTSESVPESVQLWLMIFPHEANLYYPQNGPVQIQASSGDWSSITYIGTEQNNGEKFDILAVLADENASKEFAQYLEDSAKTEEWKGLKQLPASAQLYDSITVTRK